MLFRSMVRVVLFGLLLSASLPAQTIIRLGTLVPKGSRWHEILLHMGEEWKKASGGKVELKIYPGGEQGDEPEMVQKLRIKKLQAVALSGAGLSGIDAPRREWLQQRPGRRRQRGTLQRSPP